MTDESDDLRVFYRTGTQSKLTPIVPVPNPSASSERAEEKEYDLLQKIAVGLRNLSVATIVGGISMFLLHPIDLIKTRLMNQRKGSAYLYRGPLDCIQQVIRKEGFMSLFRGVQPHMLGVAIERSIKLQVHNLMQQAFHALDDEKDDDRKPSLLLEALAGGCAGACQLLVTNPMEITSIRLQLYGETARLLKERGIVSPSSSTMVGVIKDLGFPGVYRGASACLIRDVPFSAIFFPSYVACKDVLVQHNSNFTGQATAADIFYAGTIAGIPASLLTTPADVVKCRLQSIARPGEASYSGIRDCVTKMYQNEGIFAFFQGSVMRVLRIAPQFGLSLLLYENLTNLTGLEKCRRPPSNLPIDPVEYSNAFPSLHDTEPGFLKRWFQSTFHREQ
jgi:solute carrier family 25 aspartate/glutamate transporter 12/13